MFRGFGTTFARFAGLATAALGVWVVVGNLIELRYSGSTLALILASGVLGAVGGLLYTASFDGPEQLRTPMARRSGWLGMLALALLPSGFSLLLFVALAATFPTLRRSSFETPEESSDVAGGRPGDRR